MFKLFSRSAREKELIKQIALLWENFNRLSIVVAQMSELMKQNTEYSQTTRHDLEFIGKQTLVIAEQQNRLIAHVVGNESFLDKIHSTTVH